MAYIQREETNYNSDIRFFSQAVIMYFGYHLHWDIHVKKINKTMSAGLFG